jgi:hypothetical protein
MYTGSLSTIKRNGNGKTGDVINGIIISGNKVKRNMDFRKMKNGKNK